MAKECRLNSYEKSLAYRLTSRAKSTTYMYRIAKFILKQTRLYFCVQ
jgi:hypothetical protein